MLEQKPSLSQSITLWDKWIVPDEELNNKFEFTKELEERIKFCITMKQYKYILSLFINKKRFKLNEMIHSLGAKTRDEQEKENNVNMIMNGSYR